MMTLCPLSLDGLAAMSTELEVISPYLLGAPSLMMETEK